MRSHTTERFRDAFQQLPKDVQDKARKAFKIWKTNPTHPGLRFKIIVQEGRIYSVRVGLGWRALGVRGNDVITWFWIGSHAEYDKLVSRRLK